MYPSKGQKISLTIQYQFGGHTITGRIAVRIMVLWIKHAAETGRTSHIRAFDRYFEEKDGKPVPLVSVPKAYVVYILAHNQVTLIV